MPEALLDDARRLLNEASRGEYDSAVAQVRLAARDAEERRRRAQYLEHEAERIKEEYERVLNRIREEEDRTGADIGLKNKTDLEALLKGASQLHDELRFSHRSAARRMRDIREGLRAVLERTEALVAGRAIERPIRPGDEVYVTKVHKWGVVEQVDKVRKRASVQVGELVLDVPLGELVPWGTQADEG